MLITSPRGAVQMSAASAAKTDNEDDLELKAYTTLQTGDAVLHLLCRGRIASVTKLSEHSGIHRKYRVRIMTASPTQSEAHGDRTNILCLADPTIYGYTETLAHQEWEKEWHADYCKRRNAYRFRKPTVEEETRALQQLKRGDAVVWIRKGLVGTTIWHRRARISDRNTNMLSIQYGVDSTTRVVIGDGSVKCFGSYDLVPESAGRVVNGVMTEKEWEAAYEKRQVEYLTTVSKSINWEDEGNKDNVVRPLNSMRVSGLFSDSTLVSKEGKSFPAHRIILSNASSVFRTHFEFDEKAGKTAPASASAAAAASSSSLDESPERGVVQLDCSSEVVDILLGVIYNENLVSGKFETLCDVLRIAHRYQIFRAFDSACDSLGEVVSADTVQKILCDVKTFRGVAGDPKTDPQEFSRVTLMNESLDTLQQKASDYIKLSPTEIMTIITTLSTRLAAAESAAPPRSPAKRSNAALSIEETELWEQDCAAEKELHPTAPAKTSKEPESKKLRKK